MAQPTPIPSFSPPPDDTLSYSRDSMSLSGHGSVAHDDFPQSPDPSLPLLPSTSPHAPHFNQRRANVLPGLSTNFVSSPLNPNAAAVSRSRTNSIHLNRVPSEESQALMLSGNSGSRGSMVLWKLASETDSLPLPPHGHENRMSRFSVASASSDVSLMSYSEDSKYPTGLSYARPTSGMVAYAYDPFLDENGPKDEEDRLHDPEDTKNLSMMRDTGLNWRGFVNIFALLSLILALLMLFVFYPIFSFFNREAFQRLITGNVRINNTGQFPDLPNLPQLIDAETPSSALTRPGFDGQDYVLVFSDEFNTPNRTFFPGDDPFWEAQDMWYWATQDLEWYDPRQITTNANGQLAITLEQVENHNLSYRSGMLQSWNKFCFTTGYIEVSLSLPGRNSDAQGYWPGAWTMGNLGRPGFGATTDGMWPYSYDSCDIGTFPNQTNLDHTAPAAALHTDAGRSKYNFELSWLSGQKLSACTCPAQDHPGPPTSSGFTGRGAPEIDILEAQKNKLGDGGKVSQSVQMAPFNADYQPDYVGIQIFNSSYTAMNSYNGSAVQQAVSALSTLPDRVFAGTGGDFATFGFEYWSDPDSRGDGFITWQADSIPTYTMQASAIGPDSQTEIGARLVPEEPMSIVLNLAIAASFQTVNLATLDFPAQLLVDYVRVYQRKGHTNVGCDPPTRPTATYIQDHLVAYSNPNLTLWSQTNFSLPKNSQIAGGC